MSSFRSYFICTSPRSGSTLLCRLLRQTGVAGYPASYFHEQSLDAWCEQFSIDRTGYRTKHNLLLAIFDAAIKEGTAGNDIFGLRLQSHSLSLFLENLALLYPNVQGDKARIEQVFGPTSFIYLNRRDKLAQAVSYIRAEQSGLWHRHADGTELERLSAPQALTYNANRIKQQIEQFQKDHELWEQWFEQTGITPVQISYDALSDDPTNSVQSILDHLNIQGFDIGVLKPDTAKLRDATSREWIARYKSEPK